MKHYKDIYLIIVTIYVDHLRPVSWLLTNGDIILIFRGAQFRAQLKYLASSWLPGLFKIMRPGSTVHMSWSYQLYPRL